MSLEEGGDLDTDAEGRGPCEDGGRDWSDAVTANEPAEARRGKKAPPWRLQREHGPADTLILDV